MAAFPHDSSISHLFSPAINFDQPNTAPCSFLHQHNLDHNHHPSAVFSVTNKNSMDSSSVITHKYFEHNPTLPLHHSNIKKRKPKHPSSPNSAQSKDMRELKAKKQKKLEKEPPTGFIHVRARRGQATDSHSLAERVRRERISERMKLLQSLVPGCDKVTGKALMLDEIINYVQSLQNQVEFLSMKLASVNPTMYDFGMDLESLMVRPDQPFQECSPTTANNTYPILDNSFLLQQQSQIPYALPQGDKQVLWGLDERQKIMNNNNSLFSFPLM